MLRYLVVVDMQNDFITGSLGNKYTRLVVPNVLAKIEGTRWDRIFVTQDTHDETYLDTLEGKRLPIVHCIEGTKGWQINSDIQKALDKNGAEVVYIKKNTFGTCLLGEVMADYMREYLPSVDRTASPVHIHVCGVCTDICVISTCLSLKAGMAKYPKLAVRDIPVIVDAECCAGTSEEAHEIALKAMEQCMIDVDRGTSNTFIEDGDDEDAWYEGEL